MERLIGDEAEQGEALGRLTDTTLAALHDAGFAGLWVPEVLGGIELWPVESLEVLEALSYADGSTGWVVMAAQTGTGTGAAYIAPSAARDLFEGKQPLISGHGAAMGRADVEGNGFRLSGNWSYASGLLQSAYIHTGGIVFENGEPRIDPTTGEPEFRIFVVPVGEATLKGNWDVLGLRATGQRRLFD